MPVHSLIPFIRVTLHTDSLLLNLTKLSSETNDTLKLNREEKEMKHKIKKNLLGKRRIRVSFQYQSIIYKCMNSCFPRNGDLNLHKWYLSKLMTILG